MILVGACVLFVEQAADSIGCVVVKKIDNTIGRLKRLCSCGIVLTHPTEKIPGLGPLIEKLMDSISVFVFTTLEARTPPVCLYVVQKLILADTAFLEASYEAGYQRPAACVRRSHQQSRSV